MQARSILPLLAGETDQGRDSVLVERQDAYWSLDMRTLRTPEWKLTVYAGQPYGELYDLVNDPGEVVNLWDDPNHAPVRQEMTLKLLSRVIEAADPLPERIAVV
jgi:arylsulfatase A-like enzyme